MKKPVIQKQLGRPSKIQAWNCRFRSSSSVNQNPRVLEAQDAWPKQKQQQHSADKNITPEQRLQPFRRIGGEDHREKHEKHKLKIILCQDKEKERRDAGSRGDGARSRLRGRYLRHRSQEATQG